MKAVYIVFNQSNTERIKFVLDRLSIRGYSWWAEVQGCGSVDGEPRFGTHTWPEMNSAVLTVVPEEKVQPIFDAVKKIDSINPEVGIHAFVWNIESIY
ncbi:PG0541 family transporter-associated protein [Microbacter margulisiae]|uniref:Nitrogen regulatory protein PII n=1 Tax=Microbacter margulisiae TaxID=1350067 RepID=A0A7W5DTE5_9PORP|nr:PG0541 family transporter-associated protein [Microbacter margulisiae]MBB3188244.1 nitrogen regulatory protein PII [Microbacter margulisiae]